MDQQKDIRLEIKPRNNLILTRMEEFGIKTVAELCRRMGTKNQQLVGELINMKTSPLVTGADPTMPVWRPIVWKIADALLSVPEELFSENLRRVKIEHKPHLHMLVGLEDLRQLSTHNFTLLTDGNTPEQDLRSKDFEETLNSAISRLTPREELIIRHRFGLNDGVEHSLEEVAEMIGVGSERVRQIENKAIMKLRHPSYSRHLRTDLSDYLYRRQNG